MGGPHLKLGQQSVPVKTTLARVQALNTLYKIKDQIDDIPFPAKIRSVNNWTCNWNEADDRNLLRGAIKYGAGNWSDVKDDLELRLTSKIQTSSEDALPQAKQLTMRF